MGGIQTPHLNAVARQMWDWYETRNIWIFATYIPSQADVQADRELRRQNADIEWSLTPFFFNQIVQIWGRPNLDLFAARYNTKCSRYFAWRPDPEAEGIDAFTYSWSNLSDFWAFPPFAVVLRTLSKIRTDKATGIVAAPYWPNQPWFPLFYDLLVGEAVILGPASNMLLSPCRRHQHPLAESLQLIVGKLSGKRATST